MVKSRVPFCYYKKFLKLASMFLSWFWGHLVFVRVGYIRSDTSDITFRKKIRSSAL